MLPFAQSPINPNCLCYYLPIDIVVDGSSPIPLSFEECKVDTGFNGDLCISLSYVQNLSQKGIRLIDTDCRVADGSRVDSQVCLAKVLRISSHQFSEPIDISVTCMGRRDKPLMGLNLLNEWIAIFHGPQGNLKLFEA